MSPLFPEPEVYSPFPPGMPPDLAQGAMPIWQIDKSFKRGEREHLFTRYPYFFSYKHALYVLRQLSDWQCMYMLTEIRLLVQTETGSWAYNDPCHGQGWRHAAVADPRLTAYGVSDESLQAGIAALARMQSEMDVSRERVRFELVLREYETLELPAEFLTYPLSSAAELSAQELLAYQQFPASMPPALVQLALPLWQYDPRYGSEENTLGDNDRHALAYEDALYVLARLLDLQTPVVLRGFYTLVYSKAEWHYDGEEFGYIWDIDYDYARTLDEFELARYSITKGQEAVSDCQSRARANGDDCKFDFRLNDAEEFVTWLKQVPVYHQTKKKSLISVLFLVLILVYLLNNLITKLPEYNYTATIAVLALAGLIWVIDRYKRSKKSG